MKNKRSLRIKPGSLPVLVDWANEDDSEKNTKKDQTIK